MAQTSAVVVQKFGGSSVADALKMRACAARVRAERQAGRGVVVVVSAMGDTTDDLLELADTVSAEPEGGPGGGPDGGHRPPPDRRELDQLLATGEQVSVAMMALVLKGEGIDAISLTGAQAGVRTDAAYGRAAILDVSCQRLQAEIAAGRVPVVAGFQGTCESGDTTTLGRGGSDTSAVAIAAALRSAGMEASCDIYKDVDGVFTADPRVEPQARQRPVVTYDEMLETAALGSQVIHPRGVELAKKFGVPLRVLHSHQPGTGTLVLPEDPTMESRVVSSVVLKKNVARVSIRGLRNAAGIQAAVFGPIAAAGISVDDIIQEDDGPGTINLTITFDRKDVAELTPIVHRVAGELNATGSAGGGGVGAVRFDSGLATVSVVGAGMRTSPGVASVLFRAFADAAIKVENITTSEIRISCVVAETDAQRAVRAAHAAFGLHSEDAEQAKAAVLGLTRAAARG
ncbi:MAG: aspartate kinase [Phycisphaerales bacterium]